MPQLKIVFHTEVGHNIQARSVTPAGQKTKHKWYLTVQSSAYTPQPGSTTYTKHGRSYMCYLQAQLVEARNCSVFISSFCVTIWMVVKRSLFRSSGDRSLRLLGKNVVFIEYMGSINDLCVHIKLITMNG